MSKENRFAVEYAKSNMGTCRVCMARIPEGVLRIGHLQAAPQDPAKTSVAGRPDEEKEQKTPDNEASAPAGAQKDDSAEAKEARRQARVRAATRWHHVQCFPRMKGPKWMDKNLPESPEQLAGWGEIKSGDKKKLAGLWRAMGKAGRTSAPAGGKRKAEGGGPTPDEAVKRPRGAAVQTGLRRQKDLAKFTSPRGVLTPKQHKAIQELEGELSSSTKAQLRSELVANKQATTGPKEDYVQRVAEGRVLGALPICPRCNRGYIHWNRIGGWYSCPGFFEPEEGKMKRCNFRTKELKRNPWERRSGRLLATSSR